MVRTVLFYQCALVTNHVCPVSQVNSNSKQICVGERNNE
jgi:hypothetical protein